MEKRGAVLTWVVIIAIVLIVGVVLVNTGFVQLSPGGGLTSYNRNECGDKLDAFLAGYGSVPTDEDIRLLGLCGDETNLKNYAGVVVGAQDGDCTLPGTDYDGNGKVGSEDLKRFLTAWKDGDSVGPDFDRSDFNGDGKVGSEDLRDLLKNWGSVNFC